MEFSWRLLILLFIVSFLIISKLLKKPTTTKLPPGPPKLPLIGNLHQLASKTTLPHRRLAELATVYGPIMRLRLGEVPTIVISSAEMAKEVMKTHDALLCNRPKMMMPQVVFYNCSDIALTPYGEYWRQVRKIATLELFTASRVQVFRPIREEEVRDVVKSLASKVGSVVNLSNTIFTLTFNITLRLAMNKKGQDGEVFRELIADVAESVSGFSIGDLYPSLKFISTITGMKRKLQGIVMRFDRIMDPIIEEHMSVEKQSKEEEDLIDVLLKFHNDNLHLGAKFSLTTNNIKAIVIELFSAASETSSTTIEWAMSELLKNPTEMEKAQDEVRRVLQGKETMVDNPSLDKLKYLKLIIKETLRLHPPLPCLVPREAMARCQINGYEVPSNSRIFINAWAIGRDPVHWKDPEMFNPRRFEGSLIDYKGAHFELIPFGSGRRICPGIGLATATIELVLAMLLYHFDWKLANGTTAEDLDMNETFGIGGRRKNDLQVTHSLYSCSGFK
ncbi:cytochrome P450 726A27-like [Beta vulgaris subsp. vulgaris]|uniref:cytochrome P450 726A27-like n=1 Tax=Beta vulgaris subsp. vulgaris TaxID=3555 RepID=UPI0025478956|nr:cytochrome P450 726A27-like [Beta vulgaris subsp. vulgaris]